MIIQMAWQMSGGRYDDRSWPPPWTDFEVPDEEGRGLVNCGAAIEVPQLEPLMLKSVPLQPVPVTATAVATSAGGDSGGDDEEDPGQPAGSPVTGNAPALPAPGDPKSAWVDYAVSQGFSEDEANAMTKTHLLQALGGRL
jgi:hypothetical protein